MNSQFYDSVCLTTFEKIVKSGWIEYDPVLRVYCYRTWSRQVTANNGRFTLYDNWRPIRYNATFNQALAFLEFGNGYSLDGTKD